MRTILTFSIALLLASLNSNAQTSKMSRVYILNSGGIYKNLKLQPTTIPDPIVIKPRHWAIIQIPGGDSLGISIGKQTYFIRFEAGKSYYFIASSDYTSATVVTENSEREFLLSVHFNTDAKPEEYTLD